MKRKSYVTAILLAVLFGPLGTLYSGVLFFVFSALLSVIAFFLYGVHGLPFGWLASIVISVLGVLSSNERAEIDETRYIEKMKLAINDD